MPVALLALDTSDIFKRVHLDVVREVLGQYFCQQEAISEVPVASMSSYESGCLQCCNCLQQAQVPAMCSPLGVLDGIGQV